MKPQRATITLYNGSGPAVIWVPPRRIRIVYVCIWVASSHTTAGADYSGAILTTAGSPITVLTDGIGDKENNVLAQVPLVSMQGVNAMSISVQFPVDRIVAPPQQYIALNTDNPSAGTTAAGCAITYESL